MYVYLTMGNDKNFRLPEKKNIKTVIMTAIYFER